MYYIIIVVGDSLEGVLGFSVEVRWRIDGNPTLTNSLPNYGWWMIRNTQQKIIAFIH